MESLKADNSRLTDDNSRLTAANSRLAADAEGARLAKVSHAPWACRVVHGTVHLCSTTQVPYCLLRRSFCTACTRPLNTHPLPVGEGTCLVWHIPALESRLQTKGLPKNGKSLSHLETSSPWVGRLPVVCTQRRNPLLLFSCIHVVAFWRQNAKCTYVKTGLFFLSLIARTYITG